MKIKIALAGNANCGKTTMFNNLTGASQYVGNWPGVTVEKKEGKLKKQKDVIVTDLPGIYSLSPYSPEEIITRDYIIKENPNAVINLVDASNIERNLYLTTQIIETGIPTVIALNMIDITRKRGDKIDARKLSQLLGCPVIETSALKNEGTTEAVEKATQIYKDYKRKDIVYSEKLENALKAIEKIISDKVEEKHLRYYAVKLFERDEKIISQFSFSENKTTEIEDIISQCEKDFDDDSESIMANERYNYVEKMIKSCYTKAQKGNLSISDKIDKIVTNRVLGIPIFLAVMWVVYYLAVSSLGTIGTDWANDGVFGDGWYLLGIGRSEYESAVEDYDLAQQKVDAFKTSAEENGVDISLFENEEISDLDMASFTDSAKDVKATLDIEDEDGVVTESIDVDVNEFETALAVEESDPASFGIWVAGIPAIVGDFLENVDCAEWLSALILDGIIGGVGAVLGFLPQMIILFLLLSILEDCGYMARIAFIMDRIFRKFGLSGKSFIPILIGTGCGVPGVMASRTIENEADRKITIMTTTFIPCGAKLPIIALIAGALFNNQGWVGFSAYCVGVVAIMFSGLILKKTSGLSGEVSPFVMELPPYHIPAVKGVLLHTWDRVKSFVVKAGTIIFVACALIWFTQSFNWQFEMVDASESILASIGNVFAPLFAPLGFGNWKAAVATITGLVAKENVVGTFGVLYGMEEVAEDGMEIWANLRNVADGGFTQVTAYSFLVFNLLCAPCFAAIGAIKREMGNIKWTLIAVGYQTALAYIAALLVTLYGTALFEGNIINLIYAIVVTAIVVLGIIYIFVKDAKRNQKRGEVDCRLSL